MRNNTPKTMWACSEAETWTRAPQPGTRTGARLGLETGKKLALALGVTLDYLSEMHEELKQADAETPSLMNEIYPYNVVMDTIYSVYW